MHFLSGHSSPVGGDWSDAGRERACEAGGQIAEGLQVPCGLLAFSIGLCRPDRFGQSPVLPPRGGAGLGMPRLQGVPPAPVAAGQCGFS